MKKLLALGALAAFALSAVAFGTASASNGGTYNPPQCGGKMVVNVTFQLFNDPDSGFFGDWAVDSLNRQLKVFDLGDGTFCATVNDSGSFVTTGPNSPQLGAPLSAGITGVINGGYVTNVFGGTLDSLPAYATRGNLGSFDATGPRPSFLSYFSSNTWDGGLPVWGWTYHTAQNGNWVNASTGSFGDIAD
jgi:hypothetical protein